MIWSKVKKALKERFSEKIKGELDFHMTGFGGSHSDGRAWITIKGKEVANFSTHESYVHFGMPWSELTKDSRWARHEKVNEEMRTPLLLMEKGEFSRGDFTDCCFQYLSMSSPIAIKNEHPIIRMLASLDKKTGKRTLESWVKKEMNPLVKFFIHYRIETEKNNSCEQ